MAIVRWDPGFEVDSLQSEVNRIFDGFFGGAGRQGNGRSRRWIPAMDLAETEDELVLTADLPGMDEDEISIEVKDRVLTIAGERSSSSEEKDRGYHRLERSHGRFARSLTLPSGVDSERVAASFDRGVLEVRIPKPEHRKPHRVAIAAPPLEGEATEQD
jgi:HSP20 family protein